jgi:hypothetical protein
VDGKWLYVDGDNNWEFNRYSKTWDASVVPSADPPAAAEGAAENKV